MRCNDVKKSHLDCFEGYGWNQNVVIPLHNDHFITILYHIVP